MNKPNLLLAAACAGLLLSGCAKSPAEKVAGNPVDPSLAQARADSQASAMLLPAYGLNRDASTRQRLIAMKGTAQGPDRKADFALPSFEAMPGGQVSASASKPRPSMAGALLKTSSRALAKTSAVGPDTAYFLLADSARGYVRWVHAYTTQEAGATVAARDTLVYLWPYSPSGASVLGHSGARDYADGSRLSYAVTDEDGDGFLNQVSTAKPLRLQKQWTTAHGDTVWKSVFHTSHGKTTYYDSVGAGAPLSWTDSMFLKGKVVRWQRTNDGDGDGFVLSAAAGAKTRVLRDSYTALGDGTHHFEYEVFGAGTDGKYLDEADNERYPSKGRIVDAQGKDRVLIDYGDGDGDGFYWNPAAANGANRVRISKAYAPSDSLPSHRDSLEQDLSGAGGSVRRVTFFSSARKYADGRSVSVSTRMPAGAAFAGPDTVQVREMTLYAAYKPKGTEDAWADRDSALTVAWMIPGDLASPADDKVTRWYSQVWRKPGASPISASELFTPGTAIGPGETPRSGTLVRELRSNPISAQSVIRSLLFQEYDLDRDESAWKRTDHFENGDSAIASGNGSAAGAGAYSRSLGNGARNSGFYDPASGTFADTLSIFGFDGREKAREVSWGEVDAAKGTADYRSKRLAGKDTATVHIRVESDGASGFILTRASAGDSARILLRGDSAILARTEGGVKQTFAWTAAGAGTFKVVQRDEDAASGAPLAEGEYVFGLDLSGHGPWTRTPAGKAATESKVQFESDGAAYVDGVKVSR